MPIKPPNPVPRAAQLSRRAKPEFDQLLFPRSERCPGQSQQASVSSRRGRCPHRPGAAHHLRCACRGRAPPRPAKPLFRANFRWFWNASCNRVGADLCVRPDTPLRGPRHGPTRRSAPTDSIATPIKPKTTGGGRALPLPVYRGALLRAPEGWAGHRRQGPRPGLLYASDRAVICLLPQKTLGARSRSQRAGQIQGVLFFHHQAGKSGSSGERVGVISVRRRA